MIRCIRVVLACVLVAATNVAAAADLRFGSLWLKWPDGFTVKSSEPPFELVGPEGVDVLISVMRPTQRPSDKPPPTVDELATSGETILTANGKKAGPAVVPLQRSLLPDGSLLLWIGSEKKSLFSSGYFLQYFILSAGGRLALITVEGKGSAEVENAKYLPIFQSVRWDL